jgi:putative tryptophan/tyrosine transport system substrate-binding protein
MHWRELLVAMTLVGAAPTIGAGQDVAPAADPTISTTESVESIADFPGPGGGPLSRKPTLRLSQNKPPSPAPAADLLVEDVPLPSNVRVSNPQDVPENFKRFSGAWVGAWGGELHHILIVESIMADGTTNIVYAVGDNPAFNVRRQWVRREATIVGNTLRVAQLATYELTGNGQLDATYETNNGRGPRATMSRIELADLTRPGATISQNKPSPPAPATVLPLLPPVARALQPNVPVIGWLSWTGPYLNAPTMQAFRAGLAENGFIEGKNLFIEYRWAHGDFGLLPSMAADLVGRQVAVIVAADALGPVLRAKTATSTIPIVFAYGGDPVEQGLVTSLNRPGGNVTGMTTIGAELDGKRLDLLLRVVPRARKVGFLLGTKYDITYEQQKTSMLAAGRALGVEIMIVEREDRDLEAAFVKMVEGGVDAMILSTFPFGNLDKIVSLAAFHKLPAIYPRRGLTRAGGLMSYDTDNIALMRRLGSGYVARILKGLKPSDLPVEQPTKFELAINLKTAKALGLTVPETLLVTADEVIQ